MAGFTYDLIRTSILPYTLTYAVVRIPKTAVLSVKSCAFSDHIHPEPYGLGAHLALSLALYIELLVPLSSTSPSTDESRAPPCGIYVSTPFF